MCEEGGKFGNLDGPVSGCGHDVPLVEVHHVDGRSVADENPADVDLTRVDHVPHGYGPVFGARHHHALVEPTSHHITLRHHRTYITSHYVIKTQRIIS